jgi:hypothetical protein
MLLTGSQENVSYGFKLLITTDARTLTALVAITATSNVQVPYTTENPRAYADLVDTIEAGKAAIGTAIFSFPAQVDPSGGFVSWEFLDAEGSVYAAGNAFDYTVRSNGVTNTSIAKAVINVPSSVPPSLENQKYQLRYTLELSSDLVQEYPTQSRYYSYENVVVVGLNTVPLGTQPSIELRGDQAVMSIVVDKLYDNVWVELYADNTKLGETRVQNFERVSSGYYFSAPFDTTNLQESLESYTIVWRYGFSNQPHQVFRESAALWITTPTVMQAIEDVKAKINKARTTLYGTPDLLFPPTTIMTWLRRAADNFNGAYGVFTSFTFTKAKGGIREYWLMYAELLAIESQYLAEGEKAFDFQGAAISLNVDRTGFLDTAASKIQSRLDNEFKPFKQNLVIKGQTGGDGSADPSKLAPGAIGAVGITITPASPWGPYRVGLPYPTIFR